MRVDPDVAAGTGRAPWFDEIDPPPPGPAQDPPAVRPVYDLDGVPLRRPLRPPGARGTGARARELATAAPGLGATALPGGLGPPSPAS